MPHSRVGRASKRLLICKTRSATRASNHAPFPKRVRLGRTLRGSRYWLSP